MKNLIRVIYLSIPGKIYFFHLLKRIYTPPYVKAGYLKFKGSFKLLVNGLIIKLYNDNSTIPTLLFWLETSGYEKQSLDIWQKLTTLPSTYLDLGANFGLFGIIAKVNQQKSDVIFIEPLPRNVARIRKNLLINKVDGTILEAATGDLNGEVTFFDMDTSENTIGSVDRSFVEKHHHASSIIPIKVKSITIDSYFLQNPLNQLSAIKVDVEGADYTTLKGAENTIKNFQPNILIEITDDINAEKINRFISSMALGYRYYQINESKGLNETESIIKSNTSRNYLLSILDASQLESEYSILVSR